MRDLQADLVDVPLNEHNRPIVTLFEPGVRIAGQITIDQVRKRLRFGPPNGRRGPLVSGWTGWINQAFQQTERCLVQRRFAPSLARASDPGSVEENLVKNRPAPE